MIDARARSFAAAPCRSDSDSEPLLRIRIRIERQVCFSIRVNFNMAHLTVCDTAVFVTYNTMELTDSFDYVGLTGGCRELESGEDDKLMVGSLQPRALCAAIPTPAVCQILDCESG